MTTFFLSVSEAWFRVRNVVAFLLGAIRHEQRAAKQNERPLQQAQRTVRVPCAAATPAHTHTHATPARQSWMSARGYLSTPLLEMAIPLVFPGRCACTRVYLCSTAVTPDLT